MNLTAPGLSVVIPTLGRPILLKTLASLAEAGGFDGLDVLVVGRVHDAGVRAGLADFLAGYPGIRHLDVSFERGDSSEKKNAGWQAARHDLIAFIDDDVAVARDWPAQIRAPFQDPAVGLASGPGLVPEDLPLMARLAGNTLASKASGYVAGRYLVGDPAPRRGRWSCLIGCNMAYRRNVLEAIGGFDPAFWPGEEMIAAWLATRAGHGLVFHPGARLFHYPRSGFRRFCRQMAGYGATRIRLIRAGVDLEWASLLPAAGVLALAVLAAASPFSPWALAAWLAGLAAYAAVNLWIAFRKAFDTRRAVDLLIFFLIPVMHISYGLAEWAELLRPGRDLSERPSGALPGESGPACQARPAGPDGAGAAR